MLVSERVGDCTTRLYCGDYNKDPPNQSKAWVDFIMFHWKQGVYPVFLPLKLIIGSSFFQYEVIGFGYSLHLFVAFYAKVYISKLPSQQVWIHLNPILIWISLVRSPTGWKRWAENPFLGLQTSNDFPIFCWGDLLLLDLGKKYLPRNPWRPHVTFKWICEAKSQVQGLMHISGETVTISDWTWRAAKFVFFLFVLGWRP